MADHTPGPWVVRYTPNGHMVNVIESTVLHQDYTKAGKPKGKPYHPPVVAGLFVVGREDARLIAAAPEGHALLAELHNRYESGGAPRPDNHYDTRPDGTGRTWAEAVADYLASVAGT